MCCHIQSLEYFSVLCLQIYLKYCCCFWNGDETISLVSKFTILLILVFLWMDFYIPSVLGVARSQRQWSGVSSYRTRLLATGETKREERRDRRSTKGRLVRTWGEELQLSVLQTQWWTITSCVPALVKQSLSFMLSGFGSQPQPLMTLTWSLIDCDVFRQMFAV